MKTNYNEEVLCVREIRKIFHFQSVIKEVICTIHSNSKPAISENKIQWEITLWSRSKKNIRFWFIQCIDKYVEAWIETKTNDSEEWITVWLQNLKKGYDFNL